MTLDLGKDVTMNLKLIPAGKFVMGAPRSETGPHHNQGPPRQVTISRPFYMAVTEVTQAQWRAVMNSQHSEHAEGRIDADNAVSGVSWDDATEFCRLLSIKTGRKVAIPSEAQWEYACRAGTSTAYSFGDDPSKLGDYAWYNENAYKKGKNSSQPVAGKKPNAWGLYDMHGNVLEWCRDWYDPKFYTQAASIDPENTTEAQFHTARGGWWRSDPYGCRSAFRSGRRGDNVGFRVMVLNVPEAD